MYQSARRNKVILNELGRPAGFSDQCKLHQSIRARLSTIAFSSLKIFVVALYSKCSIDSERKSRRMAMDVAIGRDF